MQAGMNKPGELLTHVLVDAMDNHLKRHTASQPLYVEEVEIKMWAQTWGSTTVGFGGIGGAAMTSAYTIVLLGPTGDACVYIAGKLAYYIEEGTPEFWDDIGNHYIVSVKEAGRYRKKS